MNVAETPSARELPGLDEGDGVHRLARQYPRGHRIDTHAHREAQLVFAAEGTMQVTTPRGRWLVPPDRAVWVPAHLPHSIDVVAAIAMRTLYFDADWLELGATGRDLNTEYVVRVSPLLREAILALFDGRPAPVRTSLLLRLCIHELERCEDSATFIPLPLEPRCRRAALMVLENPADVHNLDAIARTVGTSARTLSRLFMTETNLSFKSWCQRARITAAIKQLSMNRHVAVKQLAADFGYASFSAFSHAFRQVTGTTPTAFSARGDGAD